MEGVIDAQNNQNSHERETSAVFTNKTINSLSKGFLEGYKPHLEGAQKQLDELCEKQSVVIEQLHNENIKISKTQHSPDLVEMFSTVRTYNQKLQNIKKDMKSIHERSTKLKKRAVRLQQHQEKETHLKMHQRELDLQREQDLIAKPNASG